MKRLSTKIIAVTVAAIPLSATVAVDASAATKSALNDDTLANYAEEMLILVNREREAEGLDPLYTTSSLQQAATTRAEEIAVTFDHTRPDGTECFSALDECGIYYYYAGENIARGYRTPAAVVDAWMSSEGHRANLMSPNYEYVGIGVVEVDGTLSWSQEYVGDVKLSGATKPAETAIRGDADYDGNVQATDAHIALVGYAEFNVYGSYGLSQTQIEALDVDEDGSVTPVDAHYILEYYASSQVHDDVTWEEIIEH